MIRHRLVSRKRLLRFIPTVTAALIIVLATAVYPLISRQIASAAALSAALSFMVPIESKAEDKPTEEITETIAEIPFEDETIPFEEDKPQEQPVVVSEPSVKPEKAGTVSRKTYLEGAGQVYIPLENGFIKNCTALSPSEIEKTVSRQPKFKIAADGSPEVLIMHTHATEAYQSGQSEWFDLEYSSRTVDLSQNVVRIGDEIEKKLNEAGIGVIHDTTLHDYPSYNGSYERSAVTVKKILSENPTIKVVLDVHRDAIQPSADSIVAPVTEIDGRSCAQVMIISGCDDGTMNMPNYKENLKLAALFQNTMAANYNALARPVLFDYRKYNQDLTTGSLLLEMGGHANSLDEAIYCGELVGECIAEALLTLK